MNIHIKTIPANERTPELTDTLLALWEQSVRASHLFLSDKEITHIRPYVPQALADIPVLLTATNENSIPLAFIGIAGQKLEMLFVEPDLCGRGIGRRLVETVLERYDVNEVAVNEQNPEAATFYRRLGFAEYRRSELDEQGNPYPILYMKRRA